MSQSSIMKLRRVCAAGAALGLLLLVVGTVVMFSMGKGPQAQPAGAVAMVGLALAMVAATTILLTSRCPFCRKWVHPWYLPRRGVHCPLCGKTVDH